MTIARASTTDDAVAAALPTWPGDGHWVRRRLLWRAIANWEVTMLQGGVVLCLRAVVVLINIVGIPSPVAADKRLRRV